MGKVLKGDFTRKNKRESRTNHGSEPVPGYQLKIAVAFSDPLIWRTILVPGHLSLAELHKAIQICMGWIDTDSHQFLVGKIFYQPSSGIEQIIHKPEYDEADFELHELEEGMQFLFTYLYEAGEGWELEIAVEEVLEEGAEKDWPVLVDGRRACPPEEIGDIHFYQAELEITDDQPEGENAKMILPGWPDFDPELFDHESVNKLLRDIR